MTTTRETSRRRILHGALAVAVGLPALPLARDPAPETAKPPGEKDDEAVSPAEDLMREHGVLKRILLIYDEAVRRLDAGGRELPPDAVADSAGIIRAFIEDYHEKLEEDFLFPRFRKADTLVDLVDVLSAQHQAGRRVTDTTVRLANARAIRDAGERKALADSLRSFVRMYAPHEAREDTVLFPALRKIVSAHEYDAFGDQFEDEEHRRFGEDGFEKYVDKVAAIEKRLGIYELAQFTPRG
jgi:hemerythrin-like domain-containing protein